MKNRKVYRRWGSGLTYITTVMSKSPADAVQQVGEARQKYVVTDMDFTEITQVYSNVVAKEVV